MILNYDFDGLGETSRCCFYSLWSYLYLCWLWSGTNKMSSL